MQELQGTKMAFEEQERTCLWFFVIVDIGRVFEAACRLKSNHGRRTSSSGSRFETVQCGTERCHDAPMSG